MKCFITSDIDILTHIFGLFYNVSKSLHFETNSWKGMINMGRIIGYARVSSREQNLIRQIEALKDYGVTEENIITDKASGKDLNRPAYISLKIGFGRLVKGDTLVIKSLDRLSRNKNDIQNELRYFQQIGVRVVVLDLPTTMLLVDEKNEWVMQMVTSIIIEVLSSIAEQERLTIKARQAEGIAVMPIKNGKRYSLKTGRPTGRPKTGFPSNWVEVYNEWNNHKITARNAMKRLGLKSNTFYRMVSEYHKT